MDENIFLVPNFDIKRPRKKLFKEQRAESSISKVLRLKTFTKSKINGNNIKIALIDSGVDRNHPSLKECIVYHHDYIKDGAQDSQYHPHGTMSAGIIASRNGIDGMAKGVKIYDYRVMDVTGYCSVINVAQALYDAIVESVDIIVIPFEIKFHDETVIKMISEAQERNILVILHEGIRNFKEYVTTTVPGGRIMKCKCSTLKSAYIAAWCALLLEKGLQSTLTSSLDRRSYLKGMAADFYFESLCIA